MKKAFLFLIIAWILTGCSNPPEELIKYVNSDTRECVQKKECSEYKLVDSYKIKYLSEAAKLNGIEEAWCLAYKFSFYDYYGYDTKSWHDAGYIYLFGRNGDQWGTLVGTHQVFPSEPEPINCDIYR